MADQYVLIANYTLSLVSVHPDTRKKDAETLVDFERKVLDHYAERSSTVDVNIWQGRNIFIRIIKKTENSQVRGTLSTMYTTISAYAAESNIPSHLLLDSVRVVKKELYEQELERRVIEEFLRKK